MKINIAKIDYKHWTINFINISGVDFADQKEEPTPTSSSMYFTLAEGQANATISYSGIYKSLHNKNLQFSYDDQNWEDWTEAKTIHAGEKLYVRGLDDYVLNNQVSSSNKFFTISQGYVECHGNIMSLCNNSNIIKSNSFQYLFYGALYLKTAPDIIADEVETTGCGSMFSNCSNLKSIDKIDVKKVGMSGFSQMFNNCSSLVNIPSILPATELEGYCYQRMFNGCESLVTAPELPATTLKSYCYYNMFKGCTSLVQAPELPADTLAEGCYQNMFQNCSKLTQAPELPATTLKNGCYSNMFNSCTSLVRAPYLPASQLVSGCYTSMFMYCSKLSYIKAGFLNRLDGALSDWVFNVSATGVYEKPVSSEFNDRGASGIPEGWTIKTYQP